MWLAIGAAVVVLACGDDAPVPPPAPPATPEGSASEPAADATYVGSARCAECHAELVERWRGTHHALAMQPADPQSVLGRFEGDTLDHFGASSRFERGGEGSERYRVLTRESDGAQVELDVAYTFGVEPLQQYLVEAEGGRLQALDQAWDTRPADAGGQRWFHLQSEPIPPGDVLHWSAASHTANGMCLECHVTGFEKGYDAATGAYDTRWAEVGVGCEACHGPASAHVELARAGALAAPYESNGFAADLRNDARWTREAGGPIAQRSPERAQHTELEACAPCHARRSAIAEGWQPGAPLLDHYRPAFLEPGLYFADGQIEDEVYVYGSFVQSRMYAAGVTCSDCHDPHGLRTRDAAQGPDAVCATCHAPEVFAAPAHHHHEADSPGASCVACHMPARTYMRVDDRRDHSFRVPRPDLAAEIGAPDACSGCHAERGSAWAAERVREWRGGEAAPAHFGSALHAARLRQPHAAQELGALLQDAATPGIARATAAALLGLQGDPSSLPALEAALADPDPLVRLGAVESAVALPEPQRFRLVSPLLRDPVRAVRIEAARLLVFVAPELRASVVAPLADALAEYRAAQERNADRPEARVNLGLLHHRMDEPEAAQREYRAALAIEPHFVPAYVNLADLYRMYGRDGEGVAALRSGIQRLPDSPDLAHALGLALVRTGEGDAALASLARATQLAPQSARFAYVHAVALNDLGNASQSIAALEAAAERFPQERAIWSGLATIAMGAGERETALRAAQTLVTLAPDDAQARALLIELETGGAAGR